MLYQREPATRFFAPHHEPHAAGAKIDKIAIAGPDDAGALGRIKSLHPPLSPRVAKSIVNRRPSQTIVALVSGVRWQTPA